MGSTCRNLAPGMTDQIASMDSMAARTNCALSSNPRPVTNGYMDPSSPAAHEKKEISLTGTNQAGPFISLESQRARLETNSGLNTSRWSGQPKWHKSQTTCVPVERAARAIGSTEEKS